MYFENALKFLKKGHVVRRKCWLKHIYLVMKDEKIYYISHTDLSPGKLIELGTPGYNLKSEDLLANDYVVTN